MAIARVLLLLPPLLLAADAPEVKVRSGPYSPAPAAFSVQTNLVEVGVAVRDHQYRLAGGLTAANFELLDNGKPQTISFFSEQRAPQPRSAQKPGQAAAMPEQPGAPRSIALFFDDTHTDAMVLQKSRDAAKRFLSGGVSPADRVAVFTASGKPAADFTTDIRALIPLLDQLKAHPFVYAHGLTNCPTLTPYQAYAIDKSLDSGLKQAKVAEAVACNCMVDDARKSCASTQDAAVQAAALVAWEMARPHSISVIERIASVVRYLATAPGNRVLIIVSPGFVSGGLEQQTSRIMDEAIRAHIAVNSLNSTGLTPHARGLEQMITSTLMSDAAVATGGQYIENNNDLAGQLRELAEPAAVSYLLGFSPGVEPDETYHHLKVKLTDRSGFHVEARPGYFQAKETEKAPASIQQRIDRLAASSETRNDVPATVRVSEGGPGVIQVDISVAVHQLKFSEQGDRHIQQLTFVTLILDRAGNVLEGKQSVVDLAVKPEKLADLEAKGFDAMTSFTMPPGDYQVREVIRETMENRFTAINSSITLPR